MTEQEKMLAGKIYDPTDAVLYALRAKAHRLSKDYNDTYDDDDEAREAILAQLLPHRGENSYFQGPIQFDYGVFTTVGRNFYANFNFTVLDCCPVTIGDDAFFGPNVTLVTPMHPLRFEDRNVKRRGSGFTDDEYAKPIVIGDNCWLSAGVTVCGGVTIGEGCVIGAGSVVTRDLPPHTLAAGTPCRPIRAITAADALKDKRELF